MVFVRGSSDRDSGKLGHGSVFEHQHLREQWVTVEDAIGAQRSGHHHGVGQVVLRRLLPRHSGEYASG